MNFIMKTVAPAIKKNSFTWVDFLTPVFATND